MEFGVSNSANNESLSPELLESMRFYLWLIADRSLASKVKQKVAPSDIVQQTLLEAHRDAGQYIGKSKGELRAWLRMILIHNVRNAERSFLADKRDVKRETAIADQANLQQDLQKSPSAIASFEEEFTLLEKALILLPDSQRRAIEYRSIRQLPFAEVGQRLDRSPEAARKLWFRSVQALQRKLADLK